MVPLDAMEAKALFKVLVALVTQLEARGLLDLSELADVLRASSGDDETDLQAQAIADLFSPAIPRLHLIEGGRQDD